MKFDFSQLPLKNRAFSEKPMTFCDMEPKQFLSAIIDLIAIETGTRRACENWQKAQLRNLLKHAYERSSFWRRRIGTKKISDLKLSDLPILTRADVIQQVKSEGSLLRQGDGFRVKSRSTSGSSGTPVQFFISGMNGHYNSVRSIAQYLMEGRDLSLNRTRFHAFDYDQAKHLQKSLRKGFTVEVTESWLGSLSDLFKSGINKHIEYWHPKRNLLFEELSKNPIGYLIVQPRLLEEIFHNNNIDFLKSNKTAMLIPVSSEISSDLRKTFETQKIPVRNSYSCEEVGLIGWECENYPTHYHIAQSNVIVDIDNNSNIAVGDNTLSRILVTHLHSYATPFIRYDIGDLGALANACKCGHDGPTISNISGRTKNLVKHSDGRLTVFFIRANDMMKLAKFDEYRIRQTTLNTIILEISGCNNLTEDQHNSFVELIKNHVGDDFTVEVRTVKEIDWGRSVKRLGFRNELI